MVIKCSDVKSRNDVLKYGTYLVTLLNKKQYRSLHRNVFFLLINVDQHLYVVF
jgi:hypothetical protein